MKLTYTEFIKLIAIKEGVRTMIANTSINREFHQGYINGHQYSGFYSEEDIRKAKPITIKAEWIKGKEGTVFVEKY